MKKFFLFSFLYLLASNYSFSQTNIYIGLENKKNNLENIFLSNFLPETTSQIDLKDAIEIKDIVRNDLYLSRYFDIKEDNLNPLSLKNDNETLNYFSKIANYYITAEVSSKDSLMLKGKVFDLRNKNIIMNKIYTANQKLLRKLSHNFSDDIIYAITGKVGINKTKIAFSNDKTSKKEIYIVDYDGENLTRLTHHNSISLLPKWSNDSNKLYYTTYKNKNPDIYEIDFKKGSISPFSTYQGLNIIGGFSPDGLNLLLTLSKGKDPSIYIMQTNTKELKKLIKKYGVSASPTYSPDGKEMAFISNISGNPQLHIYNFETGKIRKLTRMNWVDSPNWSNDGKWIVFSGRENKREKMNIFITDPTGSTIKRLTLNEGNNEDPSFSSDSRFIVFTSTRNKKREIFVMDIDGSAPHPLINNLEGNSYTPSWSY